MKGRGLTPACVQSQKGKEVKEVFILYFFPFFDFFDFAIKNLAAETRGMDAAVSIAIRRRRIDGVCRRQTGMDAGCDDS
jgi:hypothetical protein